jgi:hypothetical protein
MRPSLIVEVTCMLLAAVLLNSCASSGGGSGGRSYIAPASPAATAWSRNEGDALSAAERAGLATAWGEEKSSYTWEREFVRASDAPVGSDAIYYNDPAGIRAMSTDLQRVGAMQDAADGLVEWGVRGKASFLTSFRERGLGRRLVQGEKGSAYSLVVRNKSARTLELVLSVDGLDVIDGKGASFSKRGYIVTSGETLVIEGFRTSNQSVAQFRFSNVASSYANLRHGNTRNVGVLGLAVFTPKNDRRYATPPGSYRGGARPFPQ